MPKKLILGETLTIERGRGMTYTNNRWTIYSHGFFPYYSVLAGQPKRTFIDSFDTIEEAQKEYPTATVIQGTTYRDPDLSHLPDDGD